MATNKEAVDAILQKIQDGTKAVFQSEQYRLVLNTMAKFHRYSVNNMILIAMQRPDATAVAGYRAWQTKFHRSVNKGEKGIQILGYAPKTVEKEVQKLNAAGAPVFGPAGQPVTETVKRQIPAYKPMYVFDVSQTSGEPLPSLGPDELQGNVQRYQVIQNALLELSPMPVAFEAFPSAAKGKTDYAEQKITIQPGMSEVQTVKTLVHEIAHAQMHQVDPGKNRTELPDRRTKEVEAESVAYVVCQHLGIDTSEYSFSYVAGWSGGKELSVLQASLSRIRDQAMWNITALDVAIEQALEQSKGSQRQVEPELPQKFGTGSFAERMNSAKEKAALANGQFQQTPESARLQREVS